MYYFNNPYTRGHDYNTFIDDQRFGGFLIPFLLGGLGGAFVVGAYNKPQQQSQPTYYYGPGYYNQGYYNQGYYPRPF